MLTVDASDAQQHSQPTNDDCPVNSRRIHDLMRLRFPPIQAELREWKHIVIGGQFSVVETMELIERFIPGDRVLIEVHRRLGGAFRKSDALEFIAENLGSSDIRMADEEFSGFVVVAQNGVATGWSRAAKHNMQDDF